MPLFESLIAADFVEAIDGRTVSVRQRNGVWASWRRYGTYGLLLFDATVRPSREHAKVPFLGASLRVARGVAWPTWKDFHVMAEHESCHDEQGATMASGRTAVATLALSRTDTEFYRPIAALGGMPYAIDMKLSVEGSGLAARLLRNILNGSQIITTTAVDTTPLQEQMFAVPTGWKTKPTGYARDRRDQC
jgi:hypothetical protein